VRDVKEKREMRSIVLVVKNMEKRIDRNGRINVVSLDGTKISLKLARIKNVYYYNGLFYIVYKTQSPMLYEKYSAKEVPRLAVYVNLWKVEYTDTGVREIELRGNPVREARDFLEELLNVNCEPVDDLYGFTPMFSLDRVNAELFSVMVKRLAVVENPVFKRIDDTVHEKAYQGRFLVAELVGKDTLSKLHVLFRMQKEPSRDILEKLKRGMLE